VLPKHARPLQAPTATRLYNAWPRLIRMLSPGDTVVRIGVAMACQQLVWQG
jgi:hypothetical protein